MIRWWMWAYMGRCCMSLKPTSRHRQKLEQVHTGTWCRDLCYADLKPGVCHYAFTLLQPSYRKRVQILVIVWVQYRKQKITVLDVVMFQRALVQKSHAFQGEVRLPIKATCETTEETSGLRVL